MDKRNGAETFRRGIITNNPLIFQIIGVCPVVAIASSVASAAAVALITAVELLVIECLACLVFKKVTAYIRVLLYAVLGFAINLPFFMLIGKLSPEISENLGIFLPLLAVSSVIAVKCETFAVKNTLKDTFVDAVATSLGYALIVMLVGTAREIFGSGTFLGKSVGLPYTAEAFLMPFGGFLVLGFIAALVKGIFSKKYAQEISSSSLDTTQIRMLHIEHLRQLIDENDDDDIFFSDSFTVQEKSRSVFKKGKRSAVPEETIEIPKITETEEATDSDKEQTVGYQPFADLLATLDTSTPNVEPIIPEEPEPDPLELKEEWDVYLDPEEKSDSSQENASDGETEENGGDAQ